MKISGRSSDRIPAILSTTHSPDSDLVQGKKNRRQGSSSSYRRKIRNPGFGGVGLKKEGGVSSSQVGKRSGPATPLLRWKFDEQRDGHVHVHVSSSRRATVAEDKAAPPQMGSKGRRKVRSDGESLVSARRLAAGLWQLQLPDVHGGGGGGERRRQGLEKGAGDQLRFETGGGHIGVPFLCHGNGRECGAGKKDLLQSPISMCGPKNGILYKVDPSMSYPNPAMERATKWDPVCPKTSDEMYRFYGQMKLLEDQQVASNSVVSSLQADLDQARARIDELETERRSSKKKLEHFLRKLADEKALWRSREHEKIRVIIDDVKDDLKRERKNRQRMEILNAKLVNELAEAKLSAKRCIQDFEKERKSRELMEEVCDELAKEIGEDKAEVEALKRESMKMRDEVDEERKMLQMAEVWREERVQMKLVDAKLTLEDKYSQLSKLIGDLEAFLKQRSTTLDIMEMKEAELLREAASKVKVPDMKAFSYEPPGSDDIFSVFEEMQQHGEANEKEIQHALGYSPASHASKIHTVSPDAKEYSRNNVMRYSNGCNEDNGEVDDDGSGWETVSQAEDQGSCYSHEESNPSVNRIRRDSNVSGSGKEWEENAGHETPDTEISEISSVSARRSKKSSSISRIWRSLPSNGENYKIISVDGTNGRLSNGRYSNAGINSPDRGSGKGGTSPHSSIGQWSSPDSVNPQINRGMKGCIDWPLGAQKNSLKAKLLEARMESQKIQLRHVLKQKI